jgi:RNA polymerase sigma factor (sigma-70 family)
MMSAQERLLAEATVEDILLRVRPRIKLLFARYEIPAEDTEDLLQQTLLAFIYQLPGIRETEPWLLGTLRHKCLLYLREKRRRLYETVDASVLELVAQPIPPAQEAADRRRDLFAAISLLPARCRELLTWRCYGLNPAELADKLGYSPASISKLTARCITTLSRHLCGQRFLVRKRAR